MKEPDIDKVKVKRGWMIFAVVLSLVLTLIVVSYRNGLDATPYETRDAVGRTMGFNDSFSHEHYGFIVGRMNLNTITIYQGGLVATHLVMMGMLIWCRSKKEITGYAWMQFFLFPWGVLGFLAWPRYVMMCLNESADREAFVDMPFVQMLGGAVWWIACALIIWQIKRSSRQEKSVKA